MPLDLRNLKCGFHPSIPNPIPYTVVTMKNIRSPFSSIETLESRIAPAGLIDVITNNGSAVIKVSGGNLDAQNITIAGSTNGTVFLIANDGETFRLNGVQDDGFLEVPGVVGNLSVDLGVGNDTLGVTGLFIGGTLGIKMGAGNNVVTVTSSAVGALAYTGGIGSDAFTANGTSLNIAKTASLKPGGGSNSFAFNSDETRIGGSVLYSGGSGNDVLSAENNVTLIGGDLILKGATGSNVLNFVSSALVVGRNVSYLSGVNGTNDPSGAIVFAQEVLRIGGSFNYVNPAGLQTLVFGSASVTEIGGAISILANPANDAVASFDAGDFFSAKSITLVGKGGRLSTNLEGGNVAIGSIKASGLKSFTFAAGGTITGTVNVQAGLGGITFQNPQESDLVISGATTLKIVSAANANSLSALSRVQFLSTFTATLGAGTDNFIADNITAFGAFKLTAGTGGDAISIDTNDVQGRSTFFQSVSINLGAGFDILTLGGIGVNDRVTAYRAVGVTGGFTNGNLETITLNPATNTFLIDPSVS